MTDQVRKILSCYRSENPGVLTNLARMLNHGRLAGTGRYDHSARGPGFRAWSGAQFRAKSSLIRSGLPFPTCH